VNNSSSAQWTNITVSGGQTVAGNLYVAKEPEQFSTDTPTKARVVPMKIKRWKGFSVTNTSQSEAKLTYIKLNSQMPCPPRGTVPVNQAHGGRSFTLQAQFAFGYGCDHSSYVGEKIAMQCLSATQN
jgi:hypothetical protein